MMVMEKIAYDLPKMVENEATFSHLIDEVLLFDCEVRTTYSYPPVLPGCLDVLCLPEALSEWLLVEKKCEFLLHWQFTVKCYLLLKISKYKNFFLIIETTMYL